MKKWDVSMKPAEYAEYQLVDAILTGEFPVESYLPAERELAEMLGVTRPTLREVLQRMARDGWIEIQHGKATRVRDYLVEGNLGVLSSIAQHPAHISSGFTANLLVLRRLVAPDYTRLAVENDPLSIEGKLREAADLSGDFQEIARYDWQLHHRLAVCSKNPVFPLLINGFAALYERMGIHYYQVEGAVALSHQFYTQLLEAVMERNSFRAQQLCESVMIESEQLWHAYTSAMLSQEENSSDVME